MRPILRKPTITIVKMVELGTVKASNAQIPSNLVAVFVGGTSGIGLYTLLALARHCATPKIYIIGRSQPAATRILSDLRALNPSGTYTFLQSDVSLMANVDAACAHISSQEAAINMLVQSQGTMSLGTETEEGMHATASLVLHSRMRFALNLLPLLRKAEGLRRVVSIFTGTKEGPIVSADLHMRSLKNPLKARGQAASCVTLLMEEAARRAPEVVFVHTYPGFVSTNIGRDFGRVARVLGIALEVVMGPWLYVPKEESGERNLWIATSGRFCAAKEGKGDGSDAAVGTDGKVGSGVYVVDEKGRVVERRFWGS
ncbi:hypothetical protein N0V90_008451 [Kalmusia sp. IMI 367209]|nr:hypothetical protein N0V90_008451 [Kalmusia sp. IMI 367209]